MWICDVVVHEKWHSKDFLPSTNKVEGKFGSLESFGGNFGDFEDESGPIDGRSVRYCTPFYLIIYIYKV